MRTGLILGRQSAEWASRPCGPAPPGWGFLESPPGADPQNGLGAAALEARQKAAKPATEDSRKSRVECEGGLKRVGGFFNPPGYVFVPLTKEAINGLATALT